MYPIRDIFAFQNVFTSLFLDKQYSTRYSIQSGDTPRSIAYFLYSSERYDWVIYCMNSIVNPYYEWPLSEDDFYDMMESKYFGKKCIFLTMDSFTNNFKVGETITNGSATATVDAWDRTLCKLTLKNTTGLFEVNDSITSSSSQGIITRIVDRAEDAVHHFETQYGVQLDPYAGYLQGYLSSVDDSTAITNKQYETSLNDSKRSIYVLRPEHIKTAETILVNTMNKLAKFDAENILR